ncbi:MAG: hypothetical protein OEY49_04765 [Candidatus Heimdallarchaeota archaeon]|nr:hypothetical protein [Candidatus Heimdallarchaeota archaeon]
MVISAIQPIDYLMVGLEVILLGMIIFHLVNKGKIPDNCKQILINERMMIKWRYNLYLMVSFSWLIAYFTTINSSPVKFLFHSLFTFLIIDNLRISIPSYVCKKNGLGGSCACDNYKYNDFYPLIGLGIIGSFSLLFFNFTEIDGFLVIIGLSLLSVSIYYFLPLKDVTTLKYPEELLISDIDNLQEFLITNPTSKKLVILLNSSCDFCEIQVKELNDLPNEFRNNAIRIIDLTNKETIDPIISFTLNINTGDKIPVPATIIFDAGMVIEQKDGVLSKEELEFLITSR